MIGEARSISGVSLIQIAERFFFKYEHRTLNFLMASGCARLGTRKAPQLFRNPLALHLKYIYSGYQVGVRAPGFKEQGPEGPSSKKYRVSGPGLRIYELEF